MNHIRGRMIISWACWLGDDFHLRPVKKVIKKEIKKVRKKRYSGKIRLELQIDETSCNDFSFSSLGWYSKTGPAALFRFKYHKSLGWLTCDFEEMVSTLQIMFSVVKLIVFYFSDPPVFTTHPHSESVNMPHTSTLFCEAEGNPTPHIEWYQNTTDGQTIKRSDERNLSIAVDYSSQGKYWCRASNIINDKENIVLSDVAQIVVKGNYIGFVSAYIF